MKNATTNFLKRHFPNLTKKQLAAASALACGGLGALGLWLDYQFPSLGLGALLWGVVSE